MPIQIKFLGGIAGSNLTGSCSLLTIKQGKRTLKVLFDAGLVQGGFRDSLEKNQEILNHIRPRDIDYVVLSHAHIDHIGRLPLLAKTGFTGRVICTDGTKSLLMTMLEDSAKIQMSEAGYLSSRLQKENFRSQNKDNSRLKLGNRDRLKRKRKIKKNVCQPLYTNRDVNTVEGLIKNGGYEYGVWIRLSHGVSLKFYPSGHVMGGGIVVFRIDGRPKPTYLCYSGDLGREDGIILPPPELVKEPLNHLVLESTYGGRTHPARDEEIAKLLDLIRRAAKRRERVIIPSFALERSQEVIYLLSYYMNRGDIPTIPIYLDSPLGRRITSVFSDGWEKGMFSDQDRLGFNPFNPDNNRYFKIVTSQPESDDLIATRGPYVVIAGSGMCDAGRVRGHLRANLSKSDTVVCLIGYMAENSLGRRLKDGHYSVRMNKEEIKVNAEIISFDSFSAHADGQFLASYAKRVLGRNRTERKQVFLVHGDLRSAEDLREDLYDIFSTNQKKKINVIIPKLNETQTII